jgi:transposase
MKKNSSRARMNVNLEELDGIIDGGMRAPLSESDGRKLKAALHALADMVVRRRTTEKTRAVLEEAQNSVRREQANGDSGEPEPKGHGRNGAAMFTGAEKVPVPHQALEPGDSCPECGCGKVYRQKEPKTLVRIVRIVGQAPLKATVFEMERLRCNGCGQLFTAEQPEQVGPRKYEETAAAMIAQGAACRSSGCSGWRGASESLCRRPRYGRWWKKGRSRSGQRWMS